MSEVAAENYVIFQAKGWAKEARSKKKGLSKPEKRLLHAIDRLEGVALKKKRKRKWKPTEFGSILSLGRPPRPKRGDGLQRCSFCGETGHKKNTCPSEEGETYRLEKKKKGIPLRRIYGKKEKDHCMHCDEAGHHSNHCPHRVRCSRCGGRGHNARTCNVSLRRCSLCGRRGHDARTCWSRHTTSPFVRKKRGK